MAEPVRPSRVLSLTAGLTRLTPPGRLDREPELHPLAHGVAETCIDRVARYWVYTEQTYDVAIFRCLKVGRADTTLGPPSDFWDRSCVVLRGADSSPAAPYRRSIARHAISRAMFLPGLRTGLDLDLIYRHAHLLTVFGTREHGHHAHWQDF